LFLLFLLTSRFLMYSWRAWTIISWESTIARCRLKERFCGTVLVWLYLLFKELFVTTWQ
jgi:hypothetical protein